MMQKEGLKRAGVELEDALSEHVRDGNLSAKQCLKILNPYIGKAKRMKVDKPIGNIPCGYTFHEGELRNIGDLEKKYSAFCFIAGTHNPDEERKRLADIIKSGSEFE